MLARADSGEVAEHLEGGKEGQRAKPFVRRIRVGGRHGAGL